MHCIVAFTKRSRRRSVLIATAVVALLGLGAAFALAARDDLDLGSRQSASDGGSAGNGNSLVKYMGPSISADGRFVAFESDADNLSTADDNTSNTILVRDFQTNTTILVSRTTGGVAADDGSTDATISADGRYVAFSSTANNLSTDDNDTLTNVFVRDLQANTTTLVSRQSASDGGAAADNANSTFPSISPDGRFVGFDSGADNLSSADDNTVTNVFLRDIDAGKTILVSRQSGGAGAGGDAGSNSSSVS